MFLVAKNGRLYGAQLIEHRATGCSCRRSPRYAGGRQTTKHYVCLVGIGDSIPAHIANLGYTGKS